MSMLRSVIRLGPVRACDKAVRDLTYYTNIANISDIACGCPIIRLPGSPILNKERRLPEHFCAKVSRIVLKKINNIRELLNLPSICPNSELQQMALADVQNICLVKPLRSSASASSISNGKNTQTNGSYRSPNQQQKGVTLRCQINEQEEVHTANVLNLLPTNTRITRSKTAYGRKKGLKRKRSPETTSSAQNVKSSYRWKSPPKLPELQVEVHRLTSKKSPGENLDTHLASSDECNTILPSVTKIRHSNQTENGEKGQASNNKDENGSESTEDRNMEDGEIITYDIPRWIPESCLARRREPPIGFEYLLFELETAEMLVVRSHATKIVRRLIFDYRSSSIFRLPRFENIGIGMTGNGFTFIVCIVLGTEQERFRTTRQTSTVNKGQLS